MNSYKNVAKPLSGLASGVLHARTAVGAQLHPARDALSESANPHASRPQWPWMSPRVKACLERLQQAIAAERAHTECGAAAWAALQQRMARSE